MLLFQVEYVGVWYVTFFYCSGRVYLDMLGDTHHLIHSADSRTVTVEQIKFAWRRSVKGVLKTRRLLLS